MSTKEVLQNIHYFLGTVLPNAYLAGNWDNDSLNHAFLWAEYCEKVYESSIGQPYFSKLDSHIRAIGTALENGGSSPACLEYLKLSSKILCKALMQNNFIENSIFQNVLKKANDKGCLEELLQETAEMKALFVALIDTLTFEELPSNVESLSHKIGTELHINVIEESIMQCSSEEEAEQLVSSYLDSSFCDVNKMKEFILLTLKSTHDVESIQKLQEIFIDGLLKRINKKDSLYQSAVVSNVWNQSPPLLSSLASKSFLFFKWYIDFLVESARSMEVNYEGTGVTWQAVPSDFGMDLTFSNIMSHLKCLLNASQKVSAATKTLLLSLASNQQESPIWHDICNNLFIS